jgi:glutamate racemase
MKRAFYIRLFLLLSILLSVLQCKQDTPQQEFEFQIITKAITDSSNPYYVDTANYPIDRSTLPIGVFDSGTGGLSVLNSILELDEFNNLTHEPGSDGIADFDTERFIYLADEANMPYGRYYAEGKADFLRELVLKDVLFLLGTQYYLSPGDQNSHQDKDPVKSIVIACNTATAYGLETTREAMDHWGLNVNITGIIEAGARSALVTVSLKGHDRSIIGVLATEGTCASGGYPASITKLSETLLPGYDVPVVQQAGIGLAGAIDGDINYVDPAATEPRKEADYFGPGIDLLGYPIDTVLWKEYHFETGNELLVQKDPQGKKTVVQLNSVTNYIRYMVTHLVITALKEYPSRSLDVVILGCTHYPYIETEIRDHFTYLRQCDEKYNRIIPDNITLINPAKSLAIGLYRELTDDDRWGKDHYSNSRFFISVPNRLLQENRIDEQGEFPYDWKYSREINTGLHYVKMVPFSDDWIGESIRRRIKEKIPTTYEVIYKN